MNEFNGPELSSASGSCPSELQAQSQSEALQQTLGSLFLSLFALAQGCAEPQQAANTIHLFIKFHFLERKERKGKNKKAYRQLLCSRDTQSWLEGWGWEAKWKSFPDSLCADWFSGIQQAK